MGLSRLRFVKARGIAHEADADLLEEAAGFIGSSMCSDRAVEGRRLQEEAALVFNDIVSAEKMKDAEDDDSPGYLPTGPSFSELCAMSNIETQKWFDDWQSKMGWWWQVQPWRSWKSACYIGLFNMVVFGLVRAVKRYKAVQFLKKIDELFPPLPPSPPKSGGDSEQCESVGEGATETKLEDIELPEMPKFPKEFKLPPIIPIPRLLPSWELVQKHNNMLALRQREAFASSVEEKVISSDFTLPETLATGGGGDALAGAAPSDEESVATSVWLSALGGFSAGAVLLIGVSTYKLARSGRLRQRRAARANELMSSPPAQIVVGDTATGLMSS